MLRTQTLSEIGGAQVNKVDITQIIQGPSEMHCSGHSIIPCPALSLEQYRFLHFKLIVIFFIIIIYKSTMHILTKYIYFYIYTFLHFAQVEIISFMHVWGGHNEVSVFWQQQSMRACTPLFRKCFELVF